MKHFALNKNFLIAGYDALLIPIAWIGAYWLRFNLENFPEWAIQQAFNILPLVILSQSIAYIYVKSFRSMWGFVSFYDLIKILKSTLTGCALILLILFITKNLNCFPRSIIPNYFLILTMLLAGSRLTIRVLKHYKKKPSPHIQRKKVLIIGAGRAGESLVRDMVRNPHQEYSPVGFIDDKPFKQGQEIHGVRILGTSKDIIHIASKYKTELIIMAIPSLATLKTRQLIETCEKTNLPVYTLPGLSHIVSGQVSLDLLRKLSLEDLLDRKPLSLNWISIQNTIANKKILISGAGGSIGSELCRQIAQLKPKQLILIENSEYNLFKLEQEISKSHPSVTIYPHLVDVKDKIAINHWIKIYKPEIIFHAAAFKHVPLLQNQIRESVTNNIFGTYNIANCAIQHGVEEFLLVSTDKAVNPENIMGASKRVAEIICQTLNNQCLNNNNKNKTQFTTVRFGNVLGSAGSVVPIFKKQIEKGGPITVTHPEITRYFMTIPESTQLILQALSIGRGGEIFVLDMGEPIKIKYLAEQMIKIAGKIPHKDIEIQYTGLRPGEKLLEELFHEHEALEATTHNKILKAHARKFKLDKLLNILNQMQSACTAYDEKTLKKLLLELVPEMGPEAKTIIEEPLPSTS